MKSLIKQLTPPIMLDLLRRARRGRQATTIEWEYIPEGWRYAELHPEVRGWNVDSVLKTYTAKWPRFLEMVRGAGPLGIAHESALNSAEEIISHNLVVSFGYALALAASGRESVSLLDWGGGIGHYALFARALLPGVVVEYHCKDVPLMVATGRELLPNDTFYDDEGYLERSYDLVFASGSLHYSEDWAALLSKLAGVTARYLCVTRLPTASHSPSYVFIQRPYDYGYNTEYLGWCINRSAVMRAAEEAGLTLVREFLIGEQPLIVGAPEPCQYRGFLFRSPNTSFE